MRLYAKNAEAAAMNVRMIHGASESAFNGVSACIVIGDHSPPTDGPKMGTVIQFDITVESLVIMKLTDVAVPVAGALPVPVQPVHT
jgi:hypothetical protein